MAEDVQALAMNYMEELFDNDIVDQSTRTKLATWLSGQVLQERQGWKRKIQMAFKEVEKERKLALDVHARIHEVNKRFEPYLYHLALFREASMYHATDTNSKIDHIDQLEKNLSAVFDMVDAYQEERIQCYQHLNVSDNTKNLSELLRKRLQNLESQVVRLESELKDTEARLTREIKVTTEALDMQIKVNEEEREKHKKQANMMQKTISNLQDTHHKESDSKSQSSHSEQNLLPKSATKKPHDYVHSAKSSLLSAANTYNPSENKPQTPAFNIHRSVSAIVVQGRDVGTQTFHQTRDCCIQVSLGVASNDTSKKQTLQGKFKEQLSLQSQSQESIKIVQVVDITDLKPLPLPGTSVYPIKNITIVKKRKHANPSLEDVIAANNNMQRLADVSLSSFSDTDPSTYAERQITNAKANAKTTRVIEFLRGQVTQLASKLEQTRLESERYQVQLSVLRQRIKDGKCNERSTPNNYRSGYTNGHLAHSPSEGKLTGVRVTPHDSPSPRLVYSMQTGQQKTKTPRIHVSNGMAKCLRCNKMYRLAENNLVACRFHPKNREQHEKYDAHGRLVKVNYLWKCCSQNGESPGCETGEHL